MVRVKQVTIGIVATAFFGVVLLLTSINRGFAENNTCNDLPNTTITESIPVASTYKIWAYIKSDSAEASPYLRIDGGDCQQLAQPTGNDWQWVSGDSGPITHGLNAGKHTFTLSINKGAVLVDKILATSELACQPIDDGNNCIEKPLEFAVSGIAPGETVTGNRVVSAGLVNPDIKGVEVEFSLDDGQSIAAAHTKPYCMVLVGEACGDYDFSQLSEGEHVLRVSARTLAGQQQAHNVPFTVNHDTPDATRVAAKSAKDLPSVEFEILGIKDKEQIQGGRAINTTVTKPTSQTTIVYRLNEKDILSRTEPPYCLQNKSDGSEGCGDWDSTAVADGSYDLFVIASAPGHKETWKKFGISIANGTQAAPKDNEEAHVVILGNGVQQAVGSTKLTIPLEQAVRSGTVVYAVNGRDIATTTTAEPITIVDTTGYVNGVYTMSATIRGPSGEETVLTSRVTVKNNALTSFSNWIEDHKAIAAGTFALGMLLVFTGVFVLTRYFRHRRFMKTHKMADYDEKTEEIIFKFFNKMPHIKSTRSIVYGMTASVVLVVGTVVMLSVGRPLKVAGLGFIAEVEDGVISKDSGFSFDHDPVTNELYLRVGDETTTSSKNNHGTEDDQHQADSEQDGGDSSPTNPSIPTPNTPPDTPAQCTPGTMITHGPCFLPSLVPAARAGFSTVRMDSVAPITAANGQGEPTAFRQRCDFSHMNTDDAVLYRNQPGRAHLHTYFGNTGANAFSTSSTLKNSGNSTCAGGIFNRSAYWVPSMVDTATGRPIAARDDRSQYHSDLEIYYKLGYQGIGYDDVRPFPDGLQMIAGNPSNATTPDPNSRTKYYCETSDPWSRFFALPSSLSIPSCPQNNVLVMTVDFPQCWDGVNLTSPNGRSHLTYGSWANSPQYTVGCPPSHPVGLPNVLMIVRWRVDTANTNTWRLTSDNYTNGPGGYSGHADYVFAWDDSAFPTVKARCYQAQLDCHYTLGDGREPRSPRF